MAPDISRQAFLRGGLGRSPVCSWGRAEKRPGSRRRRAHQTGVPSAAASRAKSAAVKRRLRRREGLFNSRFDNSTPAAVVTVQSTGDVQQAVAFAANNGLQVAARSGGHSYIGASAANGVMVVDLRQLPGGITYDDASGFVTIPAAAGLDSVQTTLGRTRTIDPERQLPDGRNRRFDPRRRSGIDARQWGLTCDALVSASVVLPSGDAITATPDDHGDLYWALRGGGGGNFGVVTSFTLRTFPAISPTVMSFTWYSLRVRLSKSSSAGISG